MSAPKPRALDLFCGAGGATRGLQLAGFHVTGIDNRPQPRYVGDAFIQADALAPPVRLSDFDLVWASPPCQAFSVMTICRGRARRDAHPNLIPAVREMLRRARVEYCIENVRGAPLEAPIRLEGDHFGLGTWRPRLFECSFFVMTEPPGRSFGPLTRAGAVTCAGSSGGKSMRNGARAGGGAAWRKAMGIDWMVNREIAQAIPPAYSEHIGRYALLAIGHEVVA